MSESQVVHVNDNIPDAIYIGRANGRAKLKASPFANPYKVGVHGTRIAVMASYNAWLKSNPLLIRGIPELRGKPLACWCRHQDESWQLTENWCHGDVLIEWLSDYTDDQLRKWGQS